jgi:Fic family protein
VDKGILKRPILYLSDFFERNRMLYYDNLMRVRTHNDMNQWLKFFLTGIIETAKKGVTTFDGIMMLQKEIDRKLKEFGNRSGDAYKVIDYLYNRPTIDAQKVAKVIDKSPRTAYKLIETLEQAEVIKEITGAERGRIYLFEDYINLFED